jgi:magnesium chelatase subunit H
MRSYVLAGDTRHYDGVIRALEARGLNAVPIFACGLDIRPAAERFFFDDGKPAIDAVLSLTGFSLVGGPAYCNPQAAEELLAALDVPYVSAQALEFQTLDTWRDSERGLMPVEATMMVAIPELDGATGPMVFGGRTQDTSPGADGDPVMIADEGRTALLADRVARLIALRKTPKADRRIAVTLFNFPPNAGATGTAAHLDVFASLHNTLLALKTEGYTVAVPESADALRKAVIQGNARDYGTDANVAAAVSTDDHVRREPHLDEIEAQWGPAPGTIQSDGQSLFVLGAHFGNVFVGVQPAFGYEGDPMRLMFEQGLAPTHAFSAFYRYLREDFAADAVLHFGTHGAMEFMPGKQAGLCERCWPERLIGDLPNVYLYAANNPSEGMIAKRRSAATLVSYLTPPLAQSGLYKELIDLSEAIRRWRQSEDDAERDRLSDTIHTQAKALDLTGEDVPALAQALSDLEETLIPYGLHAVGAPLVDDERRDYLRAIAAADMDHVLADDAVDRIAAGEPADSVAVDFEFIDGTVERAALDRVAGAQRHLKGDSEIGGLLKALDGRFIHPVPGGDLIRTPEILPTGRNMHGFDPFRLPSSFAVRDGAEQAKRLLERHAADSGAMPKTVAMVLWGTDNLKSEGGPIGQALALIGARPRHDSFGRIAGAELIPLDELGRARIDVVMTLSGIFRDLLPMQTRMLAEAAYLAAAAEDEPLEMNAVRANTLAHMDSAGCDFDEAAMRVFSNADGAYGSNVNHLIDTGAWEDEDELGDVFTQRKSFAFNHRGQSVQRQDLLKTMLGRVDAAYQNLESAETGVTTLDQYFDTLGGITRAAASAGGKAVPVYIGDQTKGAGTVRTLGEQVGLETRTRALNPLWYEGMLKHGYEGVRQIEAHITNTMGWSATTGQVDPWVYKHLSETFILDPEMRKRLSDLNAKASARVANRLLEASERNYWTPDAETLEALRQAGDELEDRLEGVGGEIAA